MLIKGSISRLFGKLTAADKEVLLIVDIKTMIDIFLNILVPLKDNSNSY